MSSSSKSGRKADVQAVLRELTAADDHELEARADLGRIITEALHHEDPKVRVLALETAAALVHREVLEPDSSLFERALALSSDEDDEVRAESAVLLGVLPPRPGASTRLRAMLGDDQMIVRREAAAALGDQKDASAAIELAACLEDPDRDTRFEAAYALAQLGDARGLSVLVDGLGVEQHRVTACEGLRKLGHADAIPPLARMARGLFVGWPDRLTALAVLYALGEHQAGTQLIDRAGARNQQERAYALTLIGEYRISAGFDLLEAAAKDPKDRARSFAIKALGSLARRSDESFFRQLATDAQAELEVRIEALRALSTLSGRDVDETLMAVGGAADPRLAAEARRALKRKARAQAALKAP